MPIDTYESIRRKLTEIHLQYLQQDQDLAITSRKRRSVVLVAIEAGLDEEEVGKLIGGVTRTRVKEIVKIALKERGKGE